MRVWRAREPLRRAEREDREAEREEREAERGAREARARLEEAYRALEDLKARQAAERTANAEREAEAFEAMIAGLREEGRKARDVAVARTVAGALIYAARQNLVGDVDDRVVFTMLEGAAITPAEVTDKLREFKASGEYERIVRDARAAAKENA